MNARRKFELKFVALTVPEIIVGTLNNLGSPWIRHAPFFPKFLMAFFRMNPVNVLAKFEVRSFTCTVPEIIAIGVLVWVANIQLRERRGVRNCTARKSVDEFL